MVKLSWAGGQVKSCAPDGSELLPLACRAAVVRTRAQRVLRRRRLPAGRVRSQGARRLRETEAETRTRPRPAKEWEKQR
jgi:hypothetical protein